jgi:GxxExxY protein
MEIEHIGREIVDSAIKVHKSLGPGLLESAYQTCLTLELRHRGFEVFSEVILPITYEGQLIEPGFRIDMWVEKQVIIRHGSRT